MDMMSDFDNLDVMVGSDNLSPIERELVSDIEESSVQYDIESNLHAREEFPIKVCLRIRIMEMLFLDMGHFGIIRNSYKGY